MPGDWWTSSLARLSTLEHKQMDVFFISGASSVDGPSTCTNPQRGLADRECLLPSKLTDGPLTQLVRVKSPGTPRTYCSCNLILSASLRTHYSMHAHASPPPGGASDCPTRGRDRVTEKLVTHPAPCLPKASRGLSQLCLLRFLWQKVKLGRGLPPSC